MVRLSDGTLLELPDVSFLSRLFLMEIMSIEMQSMSKNRAGRVVACTYITHQVETHRNAARH